MLLTISTTHQPATDLGFLLHKHPDRMHTSNLSYGLATVVYPEANHERCTAALIIDVDPVALVRGSDKAKVAVTLGQYVNDRPYASSSFLSTALAKVFGTAMSGRSKDRQELADKAIPLEICIPALSCRGGESILRRLFEPLGYEVTAEAILLDETVPHWGASRYFDVTLRATIVLRESLEHLLLLIPVLDDAKHYWVGDEEIERLVRRGGIWLASHPDRELISIRALRRDKRLVREALSRLASLDTGGAEVDVDEADDLANEEEQAIEERISLNDQRIDAVIRAVKLSGARRVADLGCGEGRIVERLLKDAPSVEMILGVDVSMRALHRAARRLHLDTMAPSKRKRVELFQGALTYRDKRLRGVDAVTLIEVIEHVDAIRLDALEAVIFGYINPTTAIVTTPNIEFNATFVRMEPGQLRHRDHRFEWTRSEFVRWTQKICASFGYTCVITPIGPLHEQHGSPTQMATFTRAQRSTATEKNPVPAPQLHTVATDREVS
jgi:3' terminal RNA ribose 2'-O-methyltransferase Hen1